MWRNLQSWRLDRQIRYFFSPLMIFLLVSSFYHKLQGRKVYPEFFSGFFWNSPLVGGGLCILGTEGDGAEWRWEDDRRCSMSASWGEVRSGLPLLLVLLLSISPSCSLGLILKSFPQQSGKFLFIFMVRREKEKMCWTVISWCYSTLILVFSRVISILDLLPTATRFCQ